MSECCCNDGRWCASLRPDNEVTSVTISGLVISVELSLSPPCLRHAQDSRNYGNMLIIRGTYSEVTRADHYCDVDDVQERKQASFNQVHLQNYQINTLYII